MNDLIAAFPHFFENIALPLEDRAELDDRDSEGDGNAEQPSHDEAVADPAPASWLDDTPFLDEDGPTTRVDVTADPRDLLDSGAFEHDVDEDLVRAWLKGTKAGRGLRMRSDMIAVYRPWHIYRDAWGIYVGEDALGFYCGGLAHLTGASIGAIAPLALRQILEHEWTHFAFEVSGTEVEDVVGDSLYESYVRTRFARADPRYSSGPLEEIVASYAEVQFARDPGSGLRRLRPTGYSKAVRHLLSVAPPGYSEWHRMIDDDDAAAIIGGVMSLIADRPIATSRWAQVHARETVQVPVYWLGDPVRVSAFGAFPKTGGHPTIKRLRKWLKLIGARKLPGRGKGSHERWTLPGGTQVGFATGAGFLLDPEAANLAQALAITRHDLFEQIARMLPLRAQT